jgi:asparagine synthase (glutamine-hydrolysing)
VCGICGVLALDGRAVDAVAVRAMASRLVHRGPDSAGELVRGPLAMGVRRLAIIDLIAGDQPIAGEGGRVHVVQNGEILNFRELRRELEAAGHRFATASDTEVLVHLYEQEGPGFVRRLRGMFALAVWDDERRRLILARDRFGIKPLFVRHDSTSLAFASELTSLAEAPGVERVIDPDALNAFLTFNSVPGPMTIFRGCRKLPPGHLLVAEDGAVREERYARPAPAPVTDIRADDRADLGAELLERLRDSVRAHLIADVPVGILLSGGIDSSLLTALAAQEAGGRLHTFSIGFAERSFDELERARSVAERYGTVHEELVVEPSAVELLPRLCQIVDEPLGDSSSLPTYLVCGLAASTVKVVLSGEGGDELFGGYQTYAADELARRVGRLAALARPFVERLPSSDRRVPLEYRAKRFVRSASMRPLERHHGWKEIFSADLRAELLRPDYRSDADPLEVLRARFAETEGAESLARLQDVDLGSYLVDDLLVKTDRMSMAHSLEARVPLLDPVVAELAHALPRHLRVRGLQTKRLMRYAGRDLLPDAVAFGPKRGFSIPAARWLREEMAGFTREVLSPDVLKRHGFFDPQPVQRLIEDHQKRREDHSRQLWGLLSFTLWWESHGAAAAVANGHAARVGAGERS